MSRTHYVKTSRELVSLYRILKEWVRLNRNIGREWCKDVDDLPWWYNERAHMSMLAGAIWRKGGHAFEEFSETKFTGATKKGSNGRIDLWFETSAGEFRAEVKNVEIPITKKAKQLKALHSLMRRAVIDARCNPADGRSRRLAIGFAVPYLRPSPLVSVAKQKSQLEWFKSLIGEVDHDAVAWVFPPIKKLPSPDGWICPGIVLWVKLVKRSP